VCPRLGTLDLVSLILGSVSKARDFGPGVTYLGVEGYASVTL